MGKTSIEWTDMVWNPVTGCTKVSEGCRNCYAERMHNRGLCGKEPFSKVVLHPERLEQPLHWRKPRKIFCCSMSDLFHPEISDEFIDRVFAAMALCPQHTFLVLTKRPQRMLEWFSYHANLRERADRVSEACCDWFAWSYDADDPTENWPLPNIMLGVSVEDQKTADERIPPLLQTPAAVRFVSIEPMLGPVDLTVTGMLPPCAQYPIIGEQIRVDWMIVGGESGPNARPMHPDWVRDVRDQCQAAGVSFHFKQWGEWAPDCLCASRRAHKIVARPIPGLLGCMFRCGKKYAGRLLDGREWNESPMR